jgi:hypothetical protein
MTGSATLSNRAQLCQLRGLCSLTGDHTAQFRSRLVVDLHQRRNLPIAA